MSKITAKQLISQIKTLKDIKPRQEWASLLKSQILAEKKPSYAKASEGQGNSATFASIFSNLFAQKSFVYSFAVMLVLILGAFGLMKLLPGTFSQKSTASITATKPAQLDPKVVAAIKNLNQTLKDNPVQNPQAIQGIAASLKTLADIPGANLTANSDVQDLYKTVVANQIIDLQKTTLTNDQQKILSDTVNLYNAGKYNEALEKMLLINQ